MWFLCGQYWFGPFSKIHFRNPQKLFFGEVVQEEPADVEEGLWDV